MTNYTEASRLYRSLGWDVVAPSRQSPESKQPAGAVHNVFGRGNTARPDQMDSWEKDFPYRNCLLKMNKGVIGIDVDDYDKWSAKTKSWIRKRGYAAILQDILRYGDLPATHSSTARGKKQPSRIYFYTVDLGVEFSGEPYDDVEIIQLHHRYACVWPSIHPETGEQYKWYGPDGEECTPPRPSDISPLPREWYAPLMTSTRTSKRSQGRTAFATSRAPYLGSASDWIDWLDEREMSFGMCCFLNEFMSRPSIHIGHDELLTLIGRLNHLQGVQRELGARKAFDVIAQAYWNNTNELRPETELSNVICYVAGEEFVPCQK